MLTRFSKAVFASLLLCLVDGKGKRGARHRAPCWAAGGGGRPGLEGGQLPSAMGCCRLPRDGLKLSLMRPGLGYFYLDFFPVMTLIWLRRKWGHLQIFPRNQQACEWRWEVF